MYQLCFYVPTSHLESVKAALFAAGAGKLGAYEGCCWQTLGQGQFKPLANSRPFIGEVQTVSQVEEYKVEMVCAESCLNAVLQALRETHPYEEPAYHAYKILTQADNL